MGYGQSKMIVCEKPPAKKLILWGIIWSRQQSKTLLLDVSSYPKAPVKPPKTRSSIRDQLQTCEHEMHQVLPVIKHHVTQQCPQVVEEFLTRYQLLSYSPILFIQ